MDWVRDRAAKCQFDAFVAEATDPLFRTACLMAGDPGDAEDLVQETFLRLAGAGPRSGPCVSELAS